MYSCKYPAESQYFRGILQGYKKARRNRRAYLHQLMSVLMVMLNGLKPKTLFVMENRGMHFDDCLILTIRGVHFDDYLLLAIRSVQRIKSC